MSAISDQLTPDRLSIDGCIQCEFGALLCAIHQLYRATDTKLGRDVATKVLPASLAGDPGRIAGF